MNTTVIRNQEWLNNTQKRLNEYMSDEKWEDIDLSVLQHQLITKILNTKNVNDLPQTINDSLVNYLYEVIDSQFKKVNLTYCK
mgnify:CR=1 FL=1